MPHPYPENSTTPYTADNYYKFGVIVKYLLYTLVAIIIFASWHDYQRQSDNDVQFHAENVEKTNTRNNITYFVRASATNFQAIALGGISNLTLNVANTSKYMLDDVDVEVSYIKADGDIYKKEIVNFPYIAPNQIMSAKAPTSPRGVRVTYQIVKIKSRALGL